MSKQQNSKPTGFLAAAAARRAKTLFD